MAQLFTRRATILLRTTLVTIVLAGVLGTALGLWYVRSEAYWKVGTPAAQPIPFRHELHAGGLGLDCRFCHTAVERSPSAGMPGADTCLSCHSRIWQAASVLEPLRSSVALGRPIRWNSVHRLPSHAHFHHGVHVTAGIACGTCHGAVATMTRTVRTETLSMGWCLECHRASAGAEAGPARDRQHADPVGAVPLLASCSTCHR